VAVPLQPIVSHDIRADPASPVSGLFLSETDPAAAAKDRGNGQVERPAIERGEDELRERNVRARTFRTPAAAGALVVATLWLLAGCASASLAPARAGGGAERVIVSSDFGGVVDVRVGDTLVVRPPMSAAEWQVSYDAAYLEFQGTPEALRHPDAAGWKFAVVRAGETALTVSPVIRGGPNPPRFTVTLHVAS